MYIIIRKGRACSSSGLTLKSDELASHVTGRWRATLKSDEYQLSAGRWQTTLKSATKREYIAQWCYYSLFQFMKDCGRAYEIYQGRRKKKGIELCEAISAKTVE